MELQPEFDIERALAEWRARFAQCTSSELDELVDHARTEFEQLQGLGLTREEAWLVATRRLGSPAAIETEFVKLDSARRIGTLLIGYLMIALVLRLTEAMATSAILLTFRFGASTYLASGGACCIAGVVLLVRWLPHWTARVPKNLGDLRGRNWIRAGVFFSGALAAGHYLETWAARTALTSIASHVEDAVHIPFALTCANLGLLGLFFIATFVAARREGRQGLLVEG